MDPLAPPEPESLEQTGLAESVVEHLILKILYFRGELYGQDLSNAIGLPFSVIQDLVEALKLRHHLQIKKSLGVGNVASLFALTEAGRARAREHLESNQYSGPAPVPLHQYVNLVRQQRPREGWLTKEALAKAFKGMVLTEGILRRIGPAISSASSLLLHGKPGDGKTFLIESLANLDTAPIFLPYAIECQGNIVQVYDPVYHQRVDADDQEPAALTVSIERSYDRRWAKCKRPFIVSGGELTLDMLDLQYNHTSKIYEAPFQLKANNGIYLIDDFGRQRATPAEVLNRWIVPMERRLDYLSFLTGGKMTAPFDAFLVFSTNLNPADLGDEAFLRRIQYKMLLKSPGRKRVHPHFRSLLHGPQAAVFARPHPAFHRKALSPNRQVVSPLPSPRRPLPRLEPGSFRKAALRPDRRDPRSRLRELLPPGGAGRDRRRTGRGQPTGPSGKSHHAGDVAVLLRLLGRPGGPDQHRLRHARLRRRLPQPRHRLLPRRRFGAAIRRNRNLPRFAEAPPSRFPVLAQPQFRSAKARRGAAIWLPKVAHA